MIKEKIEEYYEQKKKEIEITGEVNKSLEEREKNKFIKNLDKSRSNRNVVKIKSNQNNTKYN